jgi:hypothetical protein
MSAIRVFQFSAFVVSFATLSASAQTFEHIGHLPNPAEGSFFVVGANLPDGRFILWNGDTVYLQTQVNGGLFGTAGSGYAGDPGFIAMSPDGQTALLGAGFSTRLYLYDTLNPAPYTPEVEIAGPTHFSGTFLTEDLVVLDRSTDDFSATELVILDLSSSKSAPTTVSVLTKAPLPEDKQVVLDKPPFSFSSSVKTDPTGTILYVMDANTRELRSFAIADIINAYNTMTPLDWTTDGTLIGAAGDYFDGGVAGFNLSGDLIIGGSAGFLQPGGIQIVDAGTGAVLDTLDPAGTQPYYTVFVNSATGDILTRTGTGQYFATFGAIAPVPALSLVALALLIALVVLAAGKRFATVQAKS